MDRRLFLFLASVGGMTAGEAFGQNIGQLIGGQGLPRGLNKTQAEGGLREALSQGAVNAVLKVGRVDGYWKDEKIRIPLPGVLGQTQRTLGRVGLGKPLDDLQLKVNRGAETAAPRARDMFVNAIRGMSVEDVVGLLRGGETSGTDYPKQKTSPGLTNLFRPPMADALNSTGAIRSLDQVVANNRLGGAMGQSPSATLTDFAVGKALDGLFHYVREEERAIRTNPAKRTTDLLRRTFGGL